MKLAFTILVLALSSGVAHARTVPAPAPAPDIAPEIEQAIAVVSSVRTFALHSFYGCVLLDRPTSLRAAVLQNQTAMLAAHNVYRALHHVPPLKWNAQVR